MAASTNTSRKIALVPAGTVLATGATNGSGFGVPSGTVGGVFIQVLTASTAPTTLDMKMQFFDPGSSTWIDLKGGSQANTVAFAQLGAVATGTAFMTMGVGITETANKAFSQTLPNSVLRVVSTVVGTSYTCGVMFIPTLSRS